MDGMDVAELRRRAEGGNPDAALELGWRCRQGIGAPQDDEEAVAWYRKASSPQAKNNLGWMCQNGLGVPQDDREALRLYAEAAEGGCATAHTNLGWMRMHGRGCVRDESAALASFRRAGELGCPAASLWLERLKPEISAAPLPAPVHSDPRPAPVARPAPSKPASPAGGERDPFEILVALNLCRVSISRIIATCDRCVLYEEYRAILDNIDPAVMRGDDHLIGLFEKLLRQIGEDVLREDESDRVRRASERGAAERLADALKGSGCKGEQFEQAAFLGPNAAAAAANLLFSLFGAYVRYRSLPERYRKEADGAVARLDAERARGY